MATATPTPSTPVCGDASLTPGAPAASVPPRWRWQRRRWSRWFGLALVLALAAEPARMLVCRNLHTVIPGQIYRSAQLTPPLLKSLVGAKGIRTVINLRGTCYPQEWYIEEARAVQELDIALEDVCFSACRLPARHELRQLVLTLEEAERPLLLHCRHGADRTGLAATVALLLEDDGDLRHARGQLSLRFGHLATGRMRVLTQFFELYSQWLDSNGRTHDRAAFRHWVLNVYNGGPLQYAWEEVTLLTTDLRVGMPAAYRVRVRNTSPFPWRFLPGSTAGFHLGYFLWADDGPSLEGSPGFHEVERAAYVDAVVEPGETFTATVVINPFRFAGRYRLRIDMVDEGHCWFYQVGADPFDTEFVVREASGPAGAAGAAGTAPRKAAP